MICLTNREKLRFVMWITFSSHHQPNPNTTTADMIGHGANNIKARRASSPCSPTSHGPTEPPRFPIMLMNPIAAAAIVAPRTEDGIGQKAGRCAYMKGPTQKIITMTGTTFMPSTSAAAKTPSPKSIIGTAACQYRSPDRSDSRPLNSIASSAKAYAGAQIR